MEYVSADKDLWGRDCSVLHSTMTGGVLSDRVLLIDDLADFGVTLRSVQGYLKEKFPTAAEVKSAVIRCKACASVQPDFHF